MALNLDKLPSGSKLVGTPSTKEKQKAGVKTLRQNVLARIDANLKLLKDGSGSRTHKLYNRDTGEVFLKIGKTLVELGPGKFGIKAGSDNIAATLKFLRTEVTQGTLDQEIAAAQLKNQRK